MSLIIFHSADIKFSISERNDPDKQRTLLRKTLEAVLSEWCFKITREFWDKNVLYFNVHIPKFYFNQSLSSAIEVLDLVHKTVSEVFEKELLDDIEITFNGDVKYGIRS